MGILKSSRHPEHLHLGAPQQKPKRIGIIDIVTYIGIEDDPRSKSLWHSKTSQTCQQ
jgi:hypothetical protein